MNVLTFLNQRLPALLAISCCLFASAMALMESSDPAASAVLAAPSIANDLPENDEPSSKAALTSIKSPPAEAAIPAVPNAKVVRLQVWPKSISLTDANDRQSLVAQLVYSNGITVDVTDRVTGKLASPLVKFENGYWIPIANGTSQLNVSVGGHKQTVPITVSGALTKPVVSFTNDVMPGVFKDWLQCWQLPRCIARQGWFSAFVVRF